MSPEDIKALRKDLRATARELAAALGIEQADVLAWERGELFPTKRHCDAMAALRARGPEAIARKPKQKGATGLAALADAELWRLVRKLAAHPDLRAAAAALAEKYPDPADEG